MYFHRMELSTQFLVSIEIPFGVSEGFDVKGFAFRNSNQTNDLWLNIGRISFPAISNIVGKALELGFGQGSHSQGAGGISRMSVSADLSPFPVSLVI